MEYPLYFIFVLSKTGVYNQKYGNETIILLFVLFTIHERGTSQKDQNKTSGLVLTKLIFADIKFCRISHFSIKKNRFNIKSERSFYLLVQNSDNFKL